MIAVRVARRLLARAYELRARWSSRPVGVALCYHAIAGEAGDPARELVAPVSAQSFDRHLARLTARYRVVPASHLPTAVAARRRGERIPIAITFDDDLRSHVSHALPALRRAGVPAAFFLGGWGLEGPTAMWWQVLQAACDRGIVEGPELRAVARRVQDMAVEERRAWTADLARRVGAPVVGDGLSAAEIGELVGAGHEVGFHTRDHDALVGLDPTALRRALTHGRDELAAAAGVPLEIISYPHGLADQAVAAAARGAGYRLGFTGTPDAVRPGGDPLRVPRRYPARGDEAGFALDLARATTRG